MTASTPPRCIVVGYDGSAASDAALKYAAEVAGEKGSIYVVHAYPPPRSWLGHPNYQRRLDAALDKANATFEHLRRETAELLDRVPWKPEIIAGDPAEAIAAVAATHHADEIVVGSRRPGRARGLLGSVAGDLTSLAECPVTVIGEDAVAHPPTAEAA